MKSLRLTEEQFAARQRKNAIAAIAPVKVKKPSKYHNEPVEIDGQKFDSKGEAERYFQLKMLARAGKISDLRRQVAFGLTVGGQHIGNYVCDFYYHDGAEWIVEDWKPGVRTDLYLWKKKHMLAEHGIAILETGR